MQSYTVKRPLQTVLAVQYLGKTDQLETDIVPVALESPNRDETFANFPMRFDPLHHLTAVLVNTPAGGKPAFPGDWIVQDGDGKFSVMHDADFAATHYVLQPAPPAPPAPAARGDNGVSSCPGRLKKRLNTITLPSRPRANGSGRKLRTLFSRGLTTTPVR